MNNFIELKYFKRRFVSKWIVLTLDMAIIALSLLIINSVIGYNDSNYATTSQYYRGLISVLVFGLIGHLVFAPHKGVIRYTSLFDIQRVFMSRTFAVCLNLIYSLFIAKNLGIEHFAMPTLVLIVNYVLSMFLLILFRLSIKFVFNAGRTNSEKPKILIYGAGEAGHLTLKVLNPSFNVVAFIDDNELKKGKQYEGIKILHSSSDIKKLVEKNGITQIVISVQNCTVSEKKAIYNKCIEWGLEVKSVPPIEEWVDGELTKSQIRPIKIEDLLGRDTIDLNDGHLKQFIENKTILVTGAAGSIGSELVRQLFLLNPSHLLMLDQAETPMYHLDMELEVQRAKSKTICKPIICDVKDQKSVEAIFKLYDIDFIFHAAAYKHVPSMETNPVQAVKVNVFGSKIIADLAHQYGVKKMVFVSTDKAVNPTNVMGATKRAAEMYIQSKNEVSETSYITTRFGNVLGSNGSVIPLFKKQIAEGGPITVTHPDITRYFMTIPEACQLVLEASFIGKGGEIFIFDMGESVKIVDLAKKMITLSGLVYGKDIKIEYVGLRPGEKLYEELLNVSEEVLPTHHKKIMISKVVHLPYSRVNEAITHLHDAVEQTEEDIIIVKLLKKIVPEFISKNSIYESLDEHVLT